MDAHRELRRDRRALIKRCERSAARRNGRGISQRCETEIKAFNTRAEQLRRMLTAPRRARADSTSHAHGDTTSEIPLQRARRMWREFKAQHKTDDTGNVASSRQHTPPDGELAHQQTSQDGICSESSPIATTKAAEVTAPSTATSHNNNQSKHLDPTTPCEVKGGNPTSQAEGAAFTAWLEDNDPYLAWLTTNKLGLSHRSSRGPRPSQLRTIPTLSPFSTWDLETSTQAQPKVKPREDDDFNIRKDIIVDGGAGTFSSPHRKYFLSHTLRPTEVPICSTTYPADTSSSTMHSFNSKSKLTSMGGRTPDTSPPSRGLWRLLSSCPVDDLSQLSSVPLWMDQSSSTTMTGSQ